MRVIEKVFIIKLPSVIVQLKQKRGYKCFKRLSATGKYKKTGLTLKDREGASMSIKSLLSITEMYNRGSSGVVGRIGQATALPVCQKISGAHKRLIFRIIFGLVAF